MAFESIDNRKYGPDKSVSVDYPSDNLVKIISDEPSSDASDFKSYAKKLSEFIVNSTPRFTVGIYGGWGTGKTTLMHMIKYELEINHRGFVETIWFDSWRYEREKYSAMVPLLRTIILGIKDGLEEMANSDLDKKKKVLSKLVTTFSKVGNAVLRNTSAEIGLSAGDVLDAGANIDINMMFGGYKSDGSFINGQERV